MSRGVRSDGRRRARKQHGLAEAGFVDGRNVRIEERWANGDYQALPALAAELVAKGVIAIAATGDVVSARAAKQASASVPIVFTIGGDPVRFGLVASFNRPGANVTGITFVSIVPGAKRVQLLHDLAPRTKRIALLMNPDNANAAAERDDAQAAAVKLGHETSRSFDHLVDRWRSTRATPARSTRRSRASPARTPMR